MPRDRRILLISGGLKAASTNTALLRTLVAVSVGYLQRLRDPQSVEAAGGSEQRLVVGSHGERSGEAALDAEAMRGGQQLKRAGDGRVEQLRRRRLLGVGA